MIKIVVDLKVEENSTLVAKSFNLDVESFDEMKILRMIKAHVIKNNIRVKATNFHKL